MPELPDITVYVESLERTIVDHAIEGVSVRSPFVVRTFEPAIDQIVGHRVAGIDRRGKRIVWSLDGGLTLVFHLMIAGRFHWRRIDSRPARKTDLAAFSFAHGTLMLTEAGKRQRASLHVLADPRELAAHDPGGLDVLSCSLVEFRSALLRENHTLKRSLTDPRIFDGIGNAYSDEILHAAGLSPIKWTSRLDDAEVARLFDAVRTTLAEWIERLRRETGDRFPERVTAFRQEMAVHGRFGQPCPRCGGKVQRIVYVENETNYCPGCQTGGRLLADRSLSRLMKDDWPRTADD